MEPILDIENLSIRYKTRRGGIHAVQDVSFSIAPSETYGIVGESGCGKSTLAYGVLRYLAPNAEPPTGRVLFHGEDILTMGDQELRTLRGNRIAMVYQDPMAALNPSLRIGDQMCEVLTTHQGRRRRDALDDCVEMLARVHMPDPRSVLHRYPHQLSGGQQQRVIIAMALLTNPDLLIMDEPTTGLDVTVEATVLDLIENLARDFNAAILYISHNLGVIARVCQRVGVMYAGEMVEEAAVEELFSNQLHPYTMGLLRCIPRLGQDRSAAELESIRGQVPSLRDKPQGCVFVPRCDFAQAECRTDSARNVIEARPAIGFVASAGRPRLLPSCRLDPRVRRPFNEGETKRRPPCWM